MRSQPRALPQTVANNLAKEHAVLDRRRAGGVSIEEAETHAADETLRIRTQVLDAAQRAARLQVVLEAAAPQAPGRGRAALRGWPPPYAEVAIRLVRPADGGRNT